MPSTLCAISSLVFNLLLSNMKLKSTVYVELTLYLGLGLAVLLVWDTVMEHMHLGELMLIAGEQLQRVLFAVAGGGGVIESFILGNLIALSSLLSEPASDNIAVMTVERMCRFGDRCRKF